MPVELDDHVDQVAPGARMWSLEDPGGQLSYKEVQQAARAVQLTPVGSAAPSFGITSSAYWFLFDVKNNSLNQHEWWLEVADARLQYVDVYIDDGSGTVIERLGGGMRSYSMRDVEALTHVFKISIPVGHTTRVAVRIKTDFAMVAPIVLWQPDTYSKESRQTSIAIAVYFGILTAMLAYNGLLWLTLRDAGYGYYFGFLSMLFINFGCFYGVMDEFFIGNQPSLINFLFPITYPLTMWFAVKFSDALLGITKKSSVFRVLYSTIIVLAAVVATLSLLGYPGTAIQLTTVLGSLSVAFAFFGGVRGCRERNLVAQYFVLGWMLFLIASGMIVLYTLKILPYTPLTKYSLLIGSSVEMILFSLALSARMRLLREASHQNQQRMLEQQAIALKHEQEARRNEQRARQHEQEAIEQHRIALQQQQQLIEQEKMATLGLLSAGIAHEINNPNSFLGMSAQTAQKRVEELRDFIAALMEDDADAELNAAFKDRFDGILSQLSLVQEGSQRIAGIVRSMRGASRNDKGEATLFDPSESLAATADLVRPSFQHIEFNTDGLSRGYQVRGFPSQLSQVFTNLIVNACHAIEEQSLSAGVVRLSSKADGDTLILSVTDNGCGMSEETLGKLFQPFFTTKTGDKGTGLGLGICRSIVNDHGGKMAVNSVQGDGTTFSIHLPIAMPTD